MRKFVTDHQSDAGFATLSTAEVLESIILPATAERKCSYLDLFRDKTSESGRPYLGPANVLVSHART